MSTTDKTESLYDSVGAPTDVEEQAPLAPAAESPATGPDSPAPAATGGTEPEAADQPVAAAPEPAAPEPAGPSSADPAAPAPVAEPEARPAPGEAHPEPGPEPSPAGEPTGPVTAAPADSATARTVASPGPDQIPERALTAEADAPTEVRTPGAQTRTLPAQPGSTSSARRAAEAVAPEDEDQVAREAQAQQEAAQRERERAERDKRLGTVRPDEEAAPVAGEAKPRPTTDKFFGSIGLFVLRVVSAGLVGVYGFQALTQRQPVLDALDSIGLPQTNLIGWGLAGLLIVIAVMILFGLGTRIAGFILAGLAVADLVLFKWGPFNPFRQGQPGFSGDIELLLAGIGWLLIFLGAGGWSLDGGMRRSKAKRKVENPL